MAHHASAHRHDRTIAARVRIIVTSGRGGWLRIDLNHVSCGNPGQEIHEGMCGRHRDFVAKPMYATLRLLTCPASSLRLSSP